MTEILLTWTYRHSLKKNALTKKNSVFLKTMKMTARYSGAQWLSGRVLDSRPRVAGSSLTGVTAFWSLSKTHLS